MPAGGKAQLGGKGDREVLENALAWADGLLIGANTLRVHESTCLIKQPELIEQRRVKGLSSQPITIVISTKRLFSSNWTFFEQPIDRWLITKGNIPLEIGFDKQFPLQKNWSETLSQLKKEGLSKLILLGGASLIGSLLQEDQIDELQLTLTPKIIGGTYSWIPHEFNNLPIQLSTADSWSLISTKSLGDNELMIKYIRNRNKIG